MRTRMLGLALSAGLLVVAFPAAASADTTGSGDGWTPITYGPLDHPAGLVCPFELKEEFPTQAVEMRVAARYPDGSPLATDFRGPLIAHFTNLSTGRTVDEDLSGTGTLYNLPDKSDLWVVPDNVGLTVPAGDPYHAQGEFVLSGGEALSISPTHQPDVLYQTKSVDVCDVLS
ncbi:hypothetical protein [Kitasatospora sp. NBC_01266]|uniref:hypothetical protein n=1 Tax=Kitasatospora sp. NBC_01266 TaxID=2903572 RepID=UPI002E31F3CC|nr:hypothetical protein [Kitasatospora sp. NBC_01266]